MARSSAGTRFYTGRPEYYLFTAPGGNFEREVEALKGLEANTKVQSSIDRAVKKASTRSFNPLGDPVDLGIWGLASAYNSMDRSTFMEHLFASNMGDPNVGINPALKYYAGRQDLADIRQELKRQAAVRLFGDGENIPVEDDVPDEEKPEVPEASADEPVILQQVLGGSASAGAYNGRSRSGDTGSATQLSEEDLLKQLLGE